MDKLHELLQMQKALFAEMRALSTTQPSRELSLAITQAQTGIHWLRDAVEMQGK